MRKSKFTFLCSKISKRYFFVAFLYFSEETIKICFLCASKLHQCYVIFFCKPRKKKNSKFDSNWKRNLKEKIPSFFDGIQDCPTVFFCLIENFYRSLFYLRDSLAHFDAATHTQQLFFRFLFSLGLSTDISAQLHNLKQFSNSIS